MKTQSTTVAKTSLELNCPASAPPTESLTRRTFLAAVGSSLAAAALPVTALAAQESSAKHSPDSKSLRIRKAVTKLTAAEKQEYIEALHKLKKVKSPYDTRLNYFDQFTSWHFMAVCCPRAEHPDTPWPSHHMPAFVPWHRMLLQVFEQALEAVSGKPLTVPYWDWADPAALDAVFADDFMGPKVGVPEQNYVVTTGPFRKGEWQLEVLSAPSDDPGQSRWLQRAYGINEAGLDCHMPTSEEVARALEIKDFDVAPYGITSDVNKSFRQWLEGVNGIVGKKCSADGVEEFIGGPHPYTRMHAAVHFYVSGSWKQGDHLQRGTLVLLTGAADPVFWLHHSMVDKMWVDWSARHGRVYVPEKEIPKTGSMLAKVPGLKTPLRPFDRVAPEICRVANVLDHRKLGYAYDTENLGL